MDQARKVATQLHGREGAALMGSVRSSTDDGSADAPQDSKQGWAELSSPPLRKQLVLGERRHPTKYINLLALRRHAH